MKLRDELNVPTITLVTVFGPFSSVSKPVTGGGVLVAGRAVATEPGAAPPRPRRDRARGEQNILVETHRLTSSLSCLLCHPNAEAAQLVIVDELDSSVFECGLNFDQS